VTIVPERERPGDLYPAQQTIRGWLTEEAAAGRVENASYGRWKWRDDR